MKMSYKIIEPGVDMVDLLRNPGTGWALRHGDDDGDAVPYWHAQEQAAQSAASLLFVDWSRNHLEPRPGQFAWKYDEEFQLLIAGALKRKLRLAFRIRVGSEQEKVPAFQRGYERFLAGFAAEFDDPSRVDFVMATGPGAERIEKYFSRVPSSGGVQGAISCAAVGGDCFPAAERQAVLGRFPARPFFAAIGYRAGEGEHWRSDLHYGELCEEWGAIRAATLAEALEHHANWLELGNVADAALWLKTPDLVQEFIELGGYRLAPARLEFPSELIPGDRIVIRSTWGNYACGVLPDPKREYRVEFALLGEDGELLASAVDPELEPGSWTTGEFHSGEVVLELPRELPSGNRYLATAIRSRRSGDGSPALKLATGLPDYGCWYLFEQFKS